MKGSAQCSQVHFVCLSIGSEFFNASSPDYISDGRIVSFAPRLPIRATMAFPVIPSNVRDRQLATNAASRCNDTADLLFRAALGEVRCYNCVNYYRDLLFCEFITISTFALFNRTIECDDVNLLLCFIFIHRYLHSK